MCDSATGQKTTDRYVSFEGIDCDRNAALVIGHVRRLVSHDGDSNPFWARFMNKVERSGRGDTGVGDALFLVHANINFIRELFEEREDEEAMALLEQLEEECC